jgi:DNA-binding CsgD family transcriptional regulator
MPTISLDDVSHTIGEIYSAAHEPLQWQQVVETMSRLFDCSRVCLTWMNDSTFDAFATVSDPDFVSEACLAAHMRDPLVPMAFAVPVGQVYNRRAIMDEGEFRRRELWSDWYRQRDLAEGLGCMLHMDGQSNWSIHAHRGLRQNEFDATETKAFQLLSDHILRAYRLGRRVQEVATFSDMFMRLPIGILRVERNGDATLANPEAERLLAMPGCPLSLVKGRLVCTDTENAAMLFSQINAAAAGVTTDGATVVLSGGAGRLVASAAPFTRGAMGHADADRPVMVILRDLSLAGSDAIENQLRTLFTLTKAEARLCIALASGFSLREAAAQADITFKTARTYLERIFAKTGTHQQSQLVALVKTARPLF